MTWYFLFLHMLKLIETKMKFNNLFLYDLNVPSSNDEGFLKFQTHK